MTKTTRMSHAVDARGSGGARRIMRLAPALAYGLAILYGGVIDIGPLPNAPVVPSDKLLHFATFWGFEWMLELAFNDFPPRARRAIAIGAAVFVGVLLELIQSALPHRSAEMLDALADTLGALSGALVSALFYRLRAARAVAG